MKIFVIRIIIDMDRAESKGLNDQGLSFRNLIWNVEEFLSRYGSFSTKKDGFET
jgi:hypothetical protein